MSRLFVTHKEQTLVNHWTKEFMKDIVGQYVYYYPVSSIKTSTNEIYEESIQKIFERPIKIDVLADQNKRENWVGDFGSYQKKSIIEVHMHLKDLEDKEISVQIGDFFVYGDETYEITDAYETNNVFGQEEYKYEMMVIGQMVGNGQFEIKTLTKYLINGRNFDDHQPKTFVQQRGLEETEEGKTKDIRELREQLGDELAEVALGEGPRKVAPTADGRRNSIYNS